MSRNAPAHGYAVYVNLRPRFDQGRSAIGTFKAMSNLFAMAFLLVQEGTLSCQTVPATSRSNVSTGN